GGGTFCMNASPATLLRGSAGGWLPRSRLYRYRPAPAASAATATSAPSNSRLIQRHMIRSRAVPMFKTRPRCSGNVERGSVVAAMAVPGSRDAGGALQRGQGGGVHHPLRSSGLEARKRTRFAYFGFACHNALTMIQRSPNLPTWKKSTNHGVSAR